MSAASDRQFDFAKEAITQVIALASGVLALSLTFSHDWAKGASSFDKWLLGTAWVLLIVSIGAGIFALSGLTGAAGQDTSNIWEPVVRCPWYVQYVLFFVALFLLMLFGILVL